MDGIPFGYFKGKNSKELVNGHEGLVSYPTHCRPRDGAGIGADGCSH